MSVGRIGGGGGQHISISFTQEWIFSSFFYCFETPKFVVTTYWLQSSAFTAWKHLVTIKCFYCMETFG